MQLWLSHKYVMQILKVFFKNRMRFFSTDFLAQTHFLSKMESTLRKRCDIEKEEREKGESKKEIDIYIYIYIYIYYIEC